MRCGRAQRIVLSTARAVRLVLGRVARYGLSIVGTGPRLVSPGCGGRCVGRSQVAVALRAVTDWPRAVGVSAATCQSFRSRVLFAADLWAGGLEALHVT